jgi:MFS transporter, DHA1 family, multidrug resistance protein
MTLPSNRWVQFRLAVILGMLTAFGSLSIDMYLPGLPAIGREFQTSAAAVQRTLAVFFLGLALGQAFYGPLSDRLGRRPPLLFGCGLYGLASIGCALSPSIEALAAMRFVQALGGCAGIVIARSIVRDLFDQRDSARMYSFLMLMMGLAPITAPLIGGQILSVFGWRAIFVALSGFGLLCLALVLFALPETLPSERRAKTGLVAAVRAYSAFITDGRFMGYGLASGLASGAMFAYIAGSPFVFIELNGVAPERYGLLFGTNALGLISAAQVNRYLVTRLEGGRILTAALTVTASSGLLLVIATMAGVGGFMGMMALLFCAVASTGFVQPNAMAAAMAPFGDRAGSAAALLGVIQFAMAAAAGGLVSGFHNGTALPMAGTVALCGVTAFLSLQLLAFRSASGPSKR